MNAVSTKFFKVEVSDEDWPAVRKCFYRAQGNDANSKYIRTSERNVINGAVVVDGRRYPVTVAQPADGAKKFKRPKVEEEDTAIEKVQKKNVKRPVAKVNPLEKKKKDVKEAKKFQCYNCDAEGHRNADCEKPSATCTKCCKPGHIAKWCATKVKKVIYECSCNGSQTCQSCTSLRALIGAMPKIQLNARDAPGAYEVCGDNLCAKISLKECFKDAGTYNIVPDFFKKSYKLSSGGYAFTSSDGDGGYHVYVLKHLSIPNVKIIADRKTYTIERITESNVLDVYKFKNDVPKSRLNTTIDGLSMVNNQNMVIYDPKDNKIHVLKAGMITDNPGLVKGASGLPVFMNLSGIWTIIGCVYGGNEKVISVCAYNSMTQKFEVQTKVDGVELEQYSDQADSSSDDESLLEEEQPNYQVNREVEADLLEANGIECDSYDSLEEIVDDQAALEASIDFIETTAIGYDSNDSLEEAGDRETLSTDVRIIDETDDEMEVSLMKQIDEVDVANREAAGRSNIERRSKTFRRLKPNDSVCTFHCGGELSCHHWGQFPVIIDTRLKLREDYYEVVDDAVRRVGVDSVYYVHGDVAGGGVFATALYPLHHDPLTPLTEAEEKNVASRLAKMYVLQPDVTRSVMRRLRVSLINQDAVMTMHGIRVDDIEYTFDEWLRLSKAGVTSHDIRSAPDDVRQTCDNLIGFFSVPTTKKKNKRRRRRKAGNHYSRLAEYVGTTMNADQPSTSHQQSDQSGMIDNDVKLAKYTCDAMNESNANDRQTFGWSPRVRSAMIDIRDQEGPTVNGGVVTPRDCANRVHTFVKNPFIGMILLIIGILLCLGGVTLLVTISNVTKNSDSVNSSKVEYINDSDITVFDRENNVLHAGDRDIIADYEMNDVYFKSQCIMSAIRIKKECYWVMPKHCEGLADMVEFMINGRATTLLVHSTERPTSCLPYRSIFFFTEWLRTMPVEINHKKMLIANYTPSPGDSGLPIIFEGAVIGWVDGTTVAGNVSVCRLYECDKTFEHTMYTSIMKIGSVVYYEKWDCDVAINTCAQDLMKNISCHQKCTFVYSICGRHVSKSKSKQCNGKRVKDTPCQMVTRNDTVVTSGCDVENNHNHNERVKKDMWKAIGVSSIIANVLMIFIIVVIFRSFCARLLCACFWCVPSASAMSYQSDTLVLAGEITIAYLSFILMLIIMLMCLARAQRVRALVTMVTVFSMLTGCSAFPFYGQTSDLVVPVMTSLVDTMSSINIVSPTPQLPFQSNTLTTTATNNVVTTPLMTSISIILKTNQISSTTEHFINATTTTTFIISTTNTTDGGVFVGNYSRCLNRSILTVTEEAECLWVIGGRENIATYKNEFYMVRERTTYYRSDDGSDGDRHDCLFDKITGNVSCKGVDKVMGQQSPMHSYVVFQGDDIKMLSFDVDELDTSVAVGFFTYQACGRTDIIYPMCGDVRYAAIDRSNKSHVVMSSLYTTGEVSLRVSNWCEILVLTAHAKGRTFKFNVSRECHLWIHNEYFNPLPYCIHECLYPKTTQHELATTKHILTCRPRQVGVWCNARRMPNGFISTGYTGEFTDIFGRRMKGEVVRKGFDLADYNAWVLKCGRKFSATSLKTHFEACVAEYSAKYVTHVTNGTGHQIHYLHAGRSCRHAVFSHICEGNVVVNHTHHSTRKGLVREYTLFVPSRITITQLPYSHKSADTKITVVGRNLIVATDTLIRVTFNNVTYLCNDNCNYVLKQGRNSIAVGNKPIQYYTLHSIRCTMDLHKDWYTWMWYQECIHRPLYTILIVIYWMFLSGFMLFACCRKPKTDTSMAQSIVIKTVSALSMVKKAKGDDGNEIEIEDVYQMMWLLLIMLVVVIFVSTAFRIANRAVHTISVYRASLVVLMISGCFGVELASSDYKIIDGKLEVKSTTIMGVASIDPDVINNKFTIKYNVPGKSVVPVPGHFKVVDNEVTLDTEFLGFTTCYKTDVKCDFSCSRGGDNFISEGDLMKKFPHQKAKAKTKLFRGVSKCVWGFMSCLSCQSDNNYRVWWYNKPDYSGDDKKSFGALFKVRETNVDLTSEVMYGKKKIRLHGSAKSETGSTHDGIVLKLSSVSAVPNPLPEHVMVFNGEAYSVDVPQYGAAKAGAFGDAQFKDFINASDFEVRDAYIPSSPNSKHCSGTKVSCGFDRWIKEHKVPLSHRDVEGCEVTAEYPKGPGPIPKIKVKNCKVGTVTFTITIKGVLTPVYDKNPSFKINNVKQLGDCRYSTGHYCNLLLDFDSDDDYQCVFESVGRSTNTTHVEVKNGRNLINVYVQALGTHDSIVMYLCGVQFYGDMDANPPQAHVKIGYNSSHDGDVSSSPGQSFRFNPFGSTLKTIKSVIVIIIIVILIVVGMVFCFKVNKKVVKKIRKVD